MSYATSGFFLWSMMLNKKELIGPSFFRWFTSMWHVICMIAIGCAAYFQLEAFWTDVVTGWALGFAVAFICGGVMVLMYPKWKQYSKREDILLPFTTNDLPPVKKGDKTTSPVSADVSPGGNTKPTVV